MDKKYKTNNVIPIDNLVEANNMKKQENLKWEPSGRFKEIMAKEEISPSELKDALIECFTTAVGGDKDLAITTLVTQFNGLGVSWEKPTKEGIIKVLKKLRELSQKYRDEDVIRNNYGKMITLVNKCKWPE